MGKAVLLERRGRGLGGFVFGTLLGPEATGPGGFGFLGLFVSGFPAMTFRALLASLCGGWCVGCVVWGCCLRTT